MLADRLADLECKLLVFGGKFAAAVCANQAEPGHLLHRLIFIHPKSRRQTDSGLGTGARFFNGGGVGGTGKRQGQLGGFVAGNAQSFAGLNDLAA